MANPIGEAFITLRPDLSKFSGEAGQAMASSLQKMGGSFSSLGRAFTAGVTLPIVGGLALSAKTAIDFQSAVTGIEQKISGTPEQLQAIVDGARAMSKELPYSSQAILEAAKNAGQMGVAADDVLKFTQITLEFGRSASMSAEEAGTAFAKFMNIMGTSFSDVERLSSTLQGLGNVGASTEKQILDLALRIAGAGKAIGLTEAEVLAFANTLISAGVEAEAGGTALSRMFIEMKNAVDGLAPTAEQLEAIAVATRAVRDANDGLITANRAVRNANEAVTDSYRGVRDANEAVTASVRGVRDANEAVADSHRGVEAANRNVESANQTLAAAYETLARATRESTQASFDARRETLSVAQAQQSLAELQARGPSQQLAMRDALLAVQEAQARVNEVRKKGGNNALEAQRAELALAQARDRLNQLTVQQRGYALDLQSAQLTVAETTNRVGTAAQSQADKYKAANKGIKDAIQGVKESEQQRLEALKGVRRAEEGRIDAIKALGRAEEGRIDALRRVRNAEEGVDDAQKARVKAQENVIAAQKALNDLTDTSVGKLGTFAKVAGLTAEEFAALFKADPAKAVQAFTDGLAKISKEGGNVFPILEKLGLGEIRSVEAILKMATSQVKIGDQIATANKLWEENIEHKRQVALAADDLSYKLAILWNKIKDISLTVGNVLIPMIDKWVVAMDPLITLAAGLAQAFADAPTGIQMVVVALALFAAAIGPVLMFIGFMLTSWAALTLVAPGVAAAITAIAVSMGGFVIAAAPFLLVAAAIALAAYLIYKNWDKIGPLIAGVAAGIKSALQGVLDFVSNNWKTIGTLLSGPFLPLVALATDAFGIRSALIGAFNAVLDFVRNNWKTIANLIISPFTSIVAAAKGAFGVQAAVMNAFAGAGSWLLTAGKNIITGLLNGITSKIPDLKKLLKKVTDMIPIDKGPPEVDRALLEPSGKLIMEGLSRGLDTGWGHVERQLQGYGPQIAASLPTPGVSAGGDQTYKRLQAMTRSVGEGAATGQMAPAGGKAAEHGIIVNNYGPIRTGQGFEAGMHTIGFGMAAEAQRRGIYV